MNENEKELHAIFSYYEAQKDRGSQEMVVALLQELQEVNGCIDSSLQQRVLDVTGTNEKMLQLIFKLYPSIRTVADRHEIVVCTGERCKNKDAMRFLQQLKRELEVDAQGISKDGRIQLRTRSCLKQCRTSPNALVDGTLYSHVQMDQIRAIMKKTIGGTKHGTI